jgi:dihydrofolate synthase/folylpolyglutamate synthase
MGGRFDATNLFETKEVAVITAISLEHTEILGSTQTEIAANKAGIITPGCFTVLAPQKDPSVRSAIGRKCHHVGAALIDVRRTYKIKTVSQSLSSQTFSMESMKGTHQYEIPLLGSFQIDNAATAVAVSNALMERGAEITLANIEAGLRNVYVPGRLEVFPANSAKNTSHATIILDGAHNHESAAALVSSLRALFGKPNVIYVVGVNRDKNVTAIWRELSVLAKRLIVTRSSNLRAMNPTDIVEVTSLQSAAETTTSEQAIDALKQAIEIAEPGDIVCVTGSLYLVADTRAWILENLKQTT